MAHEIGLSSVSPPKLVRFWLIKTEGLRRDYCVGGVAIPALDGVTLTIGRGEFVAVMGPSGSGKSTLLHLLGCLDSPTDGRYWLDGQDVSLLDRDQRAAIRNSQIGFLFQSLNLLPRMTAIENVEAPLQYARVPAAERRRRAEECLRAVELRERANHCPSQLSGGEQQRVAIARALVNKPALVLADEPTGALDTRNSRQVMSILQRLNRKEGVTIVLVTHEPEVAACAGRLVTLRDGRVISDERWLADSLAQKTSGGEREGRTRVVLSATTEDIQTASDLKLLNVEQTPPPPRATPPASGSPSTDVSQPAEAEARLRATPPSPAPSPSALSPPSRDDSPAAWGSPSTRSEPGRELFLRGPSPSQRFDDGVRLGGVRLRKHDARPVWPCLLPPPAAIWLGEYAWFLARANFLTYGTGWVAAAGAGSMPLFTTIAATRTSLEFLRASRAPVADGPIRQTRQHNED